MKYAFLLFLFVFISCNTSNESQADTFNAKGNIEKAITHYKLAIEEGSIESMYKLARLYSNHHKPNEAKKYYIMGFENGHIGAAETMSSFSLSDGNYKDVITYAKKNADHGNKSAIYDLGQAYLHLHENDLAIKYLILDKNSVYIKDLLGQAYYNKGDFESAEKHWKSAVDDHTSGAVNSHRKLINLYLQLKRQEDYLRYKDQY